MAEHKKPQLQGDLLFLSGDSFAFTQQQIDLLNAIEACGSISAAAKRVGISYKTAWDRVDAMNNLAEQPLVIRSAGGARGGGTRVTELGRNIAHGFGELQAEHRAFVEQLGERLHSLSDIANFIRSGNVKTSARNQFRGQVCAITPGAVNAEVALEISPDQTLTAIITSDSLSTLGLATGESAIALIKASSVILSGDIDIRTSARNKLTGRISRIERGAVNCDVTLDMGAGKSIAAIITKESLEQLGLNEGDKACALFKASSVILMAD